MCYSAQVIQALKRLEREFSARPDYPQILREFWRRVEEMNMRIPRAFEDNFMDPRNADEEKIKAAIVEYRQKASTKWEQLFRQKKRLADAERKLKDKETKAALTDQRIAGNKIEYLTKLLDDLKRTKPKSRDARIFPMQYAPIVIREDGENKIVLARYHCRQAHQAPSIDFKFPGLYNARRDNIEKFWRKEFGHTHAVAVVESFYENVDRDGKNAVLQFVPKPARPMMVACVYARWGRGDNEMISFAAITDEPPAEVAAAGHDRVIINLKEENVDAWLSPEGRSTAELQAILADPQRPYYEHTALAA